MYHCHLNIYLVGQPCRAFDIIREMPPLEHFSHAFTAGTGPDRALAAQAGAIFVSLAGMDACTVVGALAGAKAENVPLILLAHDTAPLPAECLAPADDLWRGPMSDEEVRLHFLRFQKAEKAVRDRWFVSQLLDTTINSSPNMIWYKDRDGIHRHVNDAFCRMVGKEKSEVTDKDYGYIWGVSPEDAEVYAHIDDAVIAAGHTCTREESVKFGDEPKTFTSYRTPLYDLDGSAMGTVGLAMDITQERAYNRSLENRNHTLETIFTSLECGLITHSLDGRHIRSVNQAALDILGYDSEEALIRGFQMVANSVMDEDKPVLRRAIRGLTKAGDSTNVEYRVLHSDGKILHVMGNIKLMEENGELFYQRFLLDCTAKELALKEKDTHQTELVRALSIDYAYVYFFNLDTGEASPLQVSPMGPELSDKLKSMVTYEAIRDFYIDEVVHPDDKAAMRQAMDTATLLEQLPRDRIVYLNYRVMRGGEPAYYEMKIVRGGRWDELRGIVIGVRSVDRQIRKDMEQRVLLEDALAQANRANRAKSVFLSNMSHDIRTPMNAIMGFTSLAIAHIDNIDKVKEYLGKIITSGSHMLSLINDVLDMSRIESGKLHLEETPCSLPDILRGLNSIVQADVHAKHQDLDIDTANMVHGGIFCDSLRLNQVLLNILSNSIKYTPDGGRITLTITERAGKSPEFGEFEFCIRDTGIGMSPDFIVHIFEPFEREKNTTTSGIQGTGLGMAITKNIVDMMRGSIRVESEQGAGTTVTMVFTFRLNTGAAAETPVPVASHITCTGRLLLTEDNELNQEIAVAILEDAGFTVEVANNGREAVDMLTASRPGYYELILMDVQMPVMNGYEATRAIRALADPALANVPILAMTANAFEEDRQEALKAGMNGHIAKPIDVDKLMETLDRFLH